MTGRTRLARIVTVTLFVPLTLAAAQDPPRDGLAQRLPFSDTPRGAAPATDGATPAAPAQAAEGEAELARFVLEQVRGRARQLEAQLAEAQAAFPAAREEPRVRALADDVQRLRAALRRAGSLCPEAFAETVREVLPLLALAEQRADELARLALRVEHALGQLAALEREALRLRGLAASYPAATRALAAANLDAACRAVEEGRRARQALDVEAVARAAGRAERTLQGACTVLKDALRVGGPPSQ